MNKTLCTAMLTAACMLVSATASASPQLNVQNVTSFAVGDVPESVTLDWAGNAYLSIGTTIRKRTPSGAISTFATLPIAAFALGVKVGPDGCIYNVSTSLDPSVAGAFVWKTCTPGTAQVFATLDPAGGPNDLAFDGRGNLFVTDPFLGRVYKVTPSGAVSVWIQNSVLDGNPAAPFLQFHACGADGIAFDGLDRNLFVGNLDYGKIIRIPVRFDGSAGTPQVFVSDPRLVGIDGFAIALDGTIFAAINGQDHLVSVSPFGYIRELYEGPPLDGVSSVAFGRRLFDLNTIYFTSSSFLKTFGFEPGTPAPALQSARTLHIGLPLP